MRTFFDSIVNINNKITETISSAFDFQIFNVGSNGAVEVDGNAAFHIDNDIVDINNSGNISTVNAPVTIDISGEDALIENSSSGTISADGGASANGTAINVTGSATILNQGTIDSDFTSVNFSGADSGGFLLNAGTITSGSRGVAVDGIGTNFINTGHVIGTDNQRNGTVYSNDTAFDFTIFNQASGVIDAGFGNNGAGVSLSLNADHDVNATVLNDGLIAGRGNAGAGSAPAGDGIRIETIREAGALGANTGTFVGVVDNIGTITSEGANGTVAGFRAVNGVNFQGELVNGSSGEISGVQNGVYFGTGDHTGGVVNNAGTISSDSRAFNIDGAGLEINNSGTIVATGNQRNGTVYADSTAQDFTLNNSGVIDAGIGLEGAGVSVELSEGGNAFDIHNSGQIFGTGNASAGATAAGDGIRLERARVDGALDGSTTGLFDGNITNSGLITAEDGANGTVAGFRAVNGVSFQGTLTNEAGGTISGVQNGVYFGNATPAGGGDHTGGVVNNAGTISSDSRALNIDGTGLEINNSGTIVATGNQRNGTVYADSTAQDFTLNNSGVIDAGIGLEGAGFSAELSEDGNDFTIHNSGQIFGTGNAGAGATAAGDGIRLERSRVDGALDGSTTGVFEGLIVNSGLITAEDGANGTVAGFRAVNGVSFQGTLLNEAGGTISGVQNGVYFGNATPAGGGDHSDGLFVNEGIVSSGSRALNIDGSGLAVVNQGSILGTGNQRNGTVYADATADDYVFVNGIHGVVDAGQGNDGSAVSLQVGDNVSAVVVNDGIFQGQGDSAIANQIGHGLRLFPGAGEDSTYDGVIVNFGTINGSAQSNAAAGVSIEGVELTGVLANFGTIHGNELGIDASSANGVNIFNAGIISGDVILSASNDVFVLTRDGVVEGHIDGGAGFDTLSLVGFSQDEANALLNSEQISGFENIVFGDDFGFGNFVGPAADAAFFDGDEDFINDNEASESIDLLAEIATIDADFAVL